MKKLLLSLFVITSFVFGADVRPFVFDGIGTDLETQQNAWESLVKYKLWGTVGVYLSNEGKLAIEEQNGYSGTANGKFNIEKEHHLGGPIIVGGELDIGMHGTLYDVQLAGGPVRAKDMRVPDWNSSHIPGTIFDGPYCIENEMRTNSQLAYDYTMDLIKDKITGGYFVGENYQYCPQEVPIIDSTLVIPTVDFDTVSDWKAGVNIGPNSYPVGQPTKIAYIHVPPDTVYTNEYGTYDLYIENLKVSSVNSFRIYVVMPPTGRLTRIFVKNGFQLDNSAHKPRIQVMYVPEGLAWDRGTGEWDLTEVQDSTKFTYVEEYQGNLLFYTNKRVDWASTDGPEYQGTFITTDTLKIGNDFSVSGQLLAKYIYIRTPYLGKFKYVPFDPPIIDIDPTALASGKFVENNTDVILPIKLDIAPITNVTFNYCYVLKDTTGIASVADFNNSLPVCGSDSGEVKILKGTKTPLINPILNVKVDDDIEYDERLILYVFNLNGAVMPNKQLSGYFNLTITDGDSFKIDTTKTYAVDENLSNVDIGVVSVIGKMDSTKLFLNPADTSKYKLDSLTGLLTLKVSFDYETTQFDTITVIALDTVKTDTAKLIIKIGDVNEKPSLADATFSFNENAATPTTIGTVTATDPDTKTEFKNNVYTIIDGNSKFTINSTTGKITTNTKFDYETDAKTYTLKVQVKDKNNPALADTATITINLKDVNEAPVVKDTTMSINENIIGTVGKLNAKDPEGKTLTYKITNSVPFKIESDGTIKTTSKLDYESTNKYTLNVTVSDGTNTVPITVTVNVKNVNEACTVKDTTFTINENATGKLGKVTATDLDKDATFGTITYSLSDNTNYSIDASGNLSLKTPFNYEVKKIDSVKVFITDGTFKDTATVKINIKNVQEGIVVTGTINPVEENVELGTPVGVITGKDGDSTKVTYTINTTDFAINPTTGVITTNSIIDYETKTEYPVTVTAKSTDGSTKDTSFVIRVINVNEPVHVNDTTFTVPENYTGPIGQIEGKDDDREPVEYSISNTNDYNIDGSGNITLKNPYDFEQKTKDSVMVYVTTPSGDKDSAKIVINIKNVNETPVLQPNDTLTVPENCKDCEVGIITAIDPDGDKITYKVEEPGFYIESTGRLITTVPLDYEKDPVITITVIATDPSGASDTLTYTIKITDVNEPVHTKDTTCNIQENFVGRTGCKIEAWDDDGTKPTYKLTDSTNYTIDSNGEITVKKPLDFETKPLDTLKVIVSDGTFNDTAIVIIKVVDVPEKTQITEVDNKPKQDTIKTNKKDHTVDYTICEGTKCENHTIDVTVTKDTVVKVCNEKKTSCDNVVFLFNDTPPIVTLTNIESTTGTIDYITIEEQKDDQIYVNKKTNELTVIVRDTVNKKESHFNINVTLDTLPTEKIVLKDYPYIIDETKAQIVPIGDDKAEIVEVIKVNGVDVVVKQVIDLKTNKLIDSVQTVSYTTIINGKEVTVEYKTDMYTGKRVTDYEVSYNIDSCTVVSYTMNENKKIVKNEEGNIGYTITYNYIDDYGNKAVAMVSIVYDDIPPVVKILEPGEGMFKTNAIAVKWTINGMVQDTLNLQRLEPGANMIIRRFVDKAGNEAMDTVWVYMKEAKAIEIQVINPVTEINKEKVDEWYSDPTHTYNKKKPYAISFVKEDEEPDVIGVGFKVDIALPSVSPTGGLATLDDIVKNGRIPVDDQGNIVGASTKSIDVEEYVNDHCTEDFKQDYRKNGINIPLYNVTYKLHLWVYSTTANYVNDFNIEYELNDQEVVSEAGTVAMVVDWIADKDGAVKAKNGHQLGTSAYITKLFSKSIAVNRCDYQTKKAGHRTVKKEDTTTTFGYKRYTQKKK
jgi:hypothetical protein